MKRQLDQLNLAHEFCCAIDGRSLSEKDLEIMCDMKKIREWPDLLTRGMIGCSLSHYKVYHQIVENNIAYALILEDDTKLSMNIHSVLIGIEKGLESGILSKEEPILLYYQSKRPVKFSSQSQVSLDNNYTINYPINIWEPLTTAAYVITYECAKKLAKLVYPIRYSPDSWGVFHTEKAINGLRCVLPLPVESGYFKSDIGYDLNKPMNNFVKRLENNNVFPVRQLLQFRRRKRAKKLNRYSIIDNPKEWNLR